MPQAAEDRPQIAILASSNRSQITDYSACPKQGRRLLSIYLSTYFFIFFLHFYLFRLWSYSVQWISPDLFRLCSYSVQWNSPDKIPCDWLCSKHQLSVRWKREVYVDIFVVKLSASHRHNDVISTKLSARHSRCHRPGEDPMCKI